MSLKNEAILVLRRKGIKARWKEAPESLKRKAGKLLKRFGFLPFSRKSPPAFSFERLVNRLK